MYSGRSRWTQAHGRWLETLSFGHPAQQIAFQEYVAAVEQCQERVERLTEQIRILVPEWRLAPVVEAFQAMRGVSLLVAATMPA